jgi:hypothetical protein
MPMYHKRPFMIQLLPLVYQRTLRQGSRIRACGPMLGMVSEMFGLPDPLTEPAKDETSGQTAGLF